MNFIINLVIYPNLIMFSFGEADKEVRKALNTHISYSEIKDGDWKLQSGEDGKYVSYDNGFIVIRLPRIPENPTDFSSLQHEIFHAVVAVMERIGTKLSDDNNENYAYLIDYLTRESYEKIMNKEG